MFVSSYRSCCASFAVVFFAALGAVPALADDCVPEPLPTCYVEFTVPYTSPVEQSDVRLSGTFNNWDTSGVEATDNGSEWTAVVFLEDGAYVEYKWLVSWPDAPGLQWCHYDGGGTFDCVDGSSNHTFTVDCGMSECEVCDPPCGEGEMCVDGVCETDPSACVPACPLGQSCVEGVCQVDDTCDPACAEGWICVEGLCEPEPCGPDCSLPDGGTKECGDNGCGGTCGSCGIAGECVDFVCVFDTPDPDVTGGDEDVATGEPDVGTGEDDVSGPMADVTQDEDAGTTSSDVPGGTACPYGTVMEGDACVPWYEAEDPSGGSSGDCSVCAASAAPSAFGLLALLVVALFFVRKRGLV